MDFVYSEELILEEKRMRDRAREIDRMGERLRIAEKKGDNVRASILRHRLARKKGSLQLICRECKSFF